MEISPGTIVGGKYQLERELVRPGARIARDRGSVWVARALPRGGHVALKRFDPDHAGAAGDLHRIERGVRAAAGLPSQHVVRVHDHGVEDGAVHVVMDLLHGEDLATRMLRRSRLPLQEAARIAEHAGDALQRAHEAGLLHRSLRPESLFLARDGDDEIVKVLDLGLPRAAAPRLVGEIAAEVSASSLHYFSPEQIRSERSLDAQTDLWSLAAILFRVITGHLPFPGDIASVVASKILLAPVPSATRFVPRLPAALDGFFEKAFARDRSRRFRSVEEMVGALLPIADLAPPPSSGLLRPPASVRGPAMEPARASSAALARARARAAAGGAGGPAGAGLERLGEVRGMADTLLGAEKPGVLRGTGAPPASGRWLFPAGLAAVLGVVVLVTVARMTRPAPAAESGARAAVLSSLAAGRAHMARPAPAAASPAALRRAPLARPELSARAASAPASAQPRPARSSSSAGAVPHGARLHQALASD
ncbi:serine/threonine-protein kinase [Sorangium sp. So ce1036]|uniref:serine/threonine-protein kinase n=1 Tax=Sorangium sp. So ce1036 TaxID=3133328 RepID=UPI003F04EA63